MPPLDCAGDFPVLQRKIDGRSITYLDNAASTLKPRVVIDAITRFYENNGANVHRGKHYLSEEASDAFEQARYRVAEFVGAFGNEIVFVRGSTEALNLVAWGLALKPDDLVVGCLDSHHSQILPWRRFAHLELVRTGPDGRVDLDHYHKLLRRGPKVVALTHCSNVTGATIPLEAMAAAAKEVCGATVVVDATQSLPHSRVDVSRLAADFLAFSGHKMMGPTGIGCLYGRRDSLERLRSYMQGGGTVDWLDEHRISERKIPHRFEAGTPAISGALGLAAALSYRDQLGNQQQEQHAHELTNALLEGAAARSYIRLIGPRSSELRIPIATFWVQGCDDLSDVARALSDSYGIMCRSGHMCAQPIVDAHGTGEVLRISGYVYNTASEIEGAFRALDEIVTLLAR